MLGNGRLRLFFLERKEVVNFSTYSLQNEHANGKKVLGRFKRKENGGSESLST